MAENSTSATNLVKEELIDIYSAVDSAKARYDLLKTKFQKKIGTVPEFYARAPGRVNLIGEHVDYCGYAVLPMAIEQDVVIAASKNNCQVLHLFNADSQYSDHEQKVSNLDVAGKQWYDYVMCGIKGVTESLDVVQPTGVNMMIDGTVPKSAGLSSSSALVCCSGLAIMFANEKQAPKSELAEICAKCERYIGTEGGGMDQAISFLADKGKAKLIEFNPLKSTDVMLPANAAFVIANSLVEMTKSETAGTHFNLRVAECRLAAKILAKQHGLDWKSLPKLGDVQKAIGKSTAEMVEIVKETFHVEPYTQSEIASLLDISEEKLKAAHLSASTSDANSFKLYQRSTHVYSEAARVWQFKDVCDKGGEDALQQLGSLMNQSHESLNDLYECSCKELNELVTLCRKSGALGSRLTGAGWGGCTVSLVPVDKVPDFLKKIEAGFYDVTPERKAKLKESLFATCPGSGAAILENL